MSEVTTFLRKHRLVFAKEAGEFEPYETLAEVWRNCRRIEIMLPMLQCAGCDNEGALRLFACWCARQVLDFVSDGRVRKAVEVSELFARGRASKTSLDAAREEATRVCLEEVAEHSQAAWAAVQAADEDATEAAVRVSANIIDCVVYFHVWDKEREDKDRAFKNVSAAMADKLRELLGNPFERPLPYFRKQNRTRGMAFAGAVVFGFGLAMAGAAGDTAAAIAMGTGFLGSVIVAWRGSLA